MDSRFRAFPTEQDIATALNLWPELAAMRVRPLLVTAFGDVYVEVEGGGVYVADPLALECTPVAESISELERLFGDAAWAEERLLVDVVLLAEARGLKRAAHEVFAVTPHPALGGAIQADRLMPMTLPVWHHLAAQFRVQLSAHVPD
jgi:hypothetical protein